MAKSDRKQPVDTGFGMIECRLGASMLCPTKRLMADLQEVAYQCNIARNAMLRAFERWREDNPEWQPAPITSKTTGEPFQNKHGLPKLLNQPLPERMPTWDGESIKCRQCKGSGRTDAREHCPKCDGQGRRDWCSPSSWLYDAGRAAAPTVNAAVIAQVSQAVWSHLKSDMPYNHHGKADYRWQAIVAHEGGLAEVHRTEFSGLIVPVPRNSAGFAYDGETHNYVSRPVAQVIQKSAGAGAIAAFPLWSNQAGRQHLVGMCRVDVRQKAPGDRRNLRRVASGEWPMRDSKIIYRDNGKKQGWFLQLAYHQPRHIIEGLNKDCAARLSWNDGDASHPFDVVVQVPLESTWQPKPWHLGKAELLKHEYARLTERRKRLRERYHDAGHGRKGHGRRRNERPTRKITGSLKSLMERWSDWLVDEIVKYCRRYLCGTLVYREPSMSRRQHTWFADWNIQYDWTGLRDKIAYKCHMHGIELQAQDSPPMSSASRVTKPPQKS